MAKTEYTEYMFTLKEGSPDEPNGDALTYLMCEPLTTELSVIGENGFITIRLKSGASLEEEKEIKNYFNHHITGIATATF